MYPIQRNRRLRSSATLRALVQENRLSPSDFIVPLFVIDKNWKPVLQSGKLGDLAPTILNRMQISIPAEMTGTLLTN